MSFWKNLADNLFGDEQPRARQPQGRTGSTVVRCTKALGWRVDHQKGETSVLEFHAKGEKAHVAVIDDNSCLISFLGLHKGEFPLEHISPDVMAYAVMVNARLGFCKWSLRESSSGLRYFACEYKTLTEAVNPELFKIVCEEAGLEAIRLTDVLRVEGLI